MNHPIRKIIFSFVFCILAWLAGLAYFVAHIPLKPIAPDVKADAIVVLTGGSGRVEYGLRLLAEGKGQKLFISGVGENASVEELMRRASADLRPRLEEKTTSITLGRKAANTIGNAEETTRWLQKEKCTSILLVTSHYHMPRSVEEFEEKAADIVIIPAAVFPDDFSPSEWWENKETRAMLLAEYHKFLASKLRHWLMASTNPS